MSPQGHTGHDEHTTESALPDWLRASIKWSVVLLFVWLAIKGIAQGNPVGAWFAIILGSVCSKLIMRIC